MKIVQIALPLFIAASLFSGAAMAQNDATPLYAGIGLGASVLDNNNRQFDGAANFDTTDHSVSIFAGYRFTENFALEAGYSDLGEYSFTGGHLDVDSYRVSAVGILPITKEVSVFGKFGFARTNYEIDDIKDTTKSAAVFGLGANYDFGNDFSLQGEWSRVNQTAAPVDTFSANVVYGF